MMTKAVMLGLHPSSSMDAVLALAARGWRVFPIAPTAKTPLVKNWPSLATGDAEKLRAWSRQYSGCNWGVACGPESEVFVLDVDGEEGIAALGELCMRFGNDWMKTLSVTTGRGTHLYFQYPDGAQIRNSAGMLAPGLDIRGSGGYSIVPPSQHPNGHQYHWINEHIAIAPAPAWLLERLTFVHQCASGTHNEAAIQQGGRNVALTSLGGSMRRKGANRETIEVALLAENRQRCEPPLPELEVRQIAASVSRYKAAGQQSESYAWPDPDPICDELLPVQLFDSAMLPEVLRPLVSDTAERMQVPLDYPAVISVLAIAGMTNRRATIQPKAADTSWVVVPNLWGGIVGAPGLLKSPVITTMTRPLTQIEALWRAEYESAENERKLQQEETDLRQAAWREQFKAAQKAGKAPPIRPDESIVKPLLRRLITQDATAEKLHEVLRDNPAGVLLIRDELSGWLATLDKPGREGERGFFLSAWNGDTGYTMDRIGRGSVHAEACCVSILGGIQPARLRGYLSDSLADGPSNDGLLQRFQVLAYPDVPRNWRYVDRLPQSSAFAPVQQLYDKIAHMEVVNPLRFRFSFDAQELFVAWLGELERKVRDTELHPALIAHLAKYRSLMPSLSLLFELADGGAETVSLRHAQQAAAWCDYLESHARRIYSLTVSPETHAASELGRHLMVGWKRDEGLFTVREVYRSCWTSLDAPERVRAALAILSDAGWVRRVDVGEGAGRPTETWAINPRLHRRQK